MRLEAQVLQVKVQLAQQVLVQQEQLVLLVQEQLALLAQPVEQARQVLLAAVLETLVQQVPVQQVQRVRRVQQEVVQETLVPRVLQVLVLQAPPVLLALQVLLAVEVVVQDLRARQVPREFQAPKSSTVQGPRRI